MTGQFSLGYRPAFDGLRGLAVLAVLMHHLGFVLPGGFIGVDIFFVLSGFLITTLLVAEYDRAGAVNLRHFYVRRFLRLVPALFVMLASVLLWVLVVDGPEAAREQFIDSLTAATYVSNWTRALDLYPSQLLSHTWSLSIEEQFYLLWPGIFLAAMKFCKRRSTLVGIALALALASLITRFVLQLGGSVNTRMYNGLDTRADALMVGCALGLTIASGLLGKRTLNTLCSATSLLGPLALLGLGGLTILANSSEPWMYYWGFTLVEGLAVVVVFDVVMRPTSRMARALRVRWLVRIGTLSYGLYLWHDPIFRIMRREGAPPLVVLVGGITLTVVCTLLSYRLVEEPALRLKSRFASVI